MWHKKLTITYIDGEVIECTTKEWPEIRADGVDLIDFGCVKKSGHSIYYLHPEHIFPDEERNEAWAWVCGSFSVYDMKAHESIITFDHKVMGRTRRDMPDLKHSQVKLGWWKEDHGI